MHRSAINKYLIKPQGETPIEEIGGKAWNLMRLRKVKGATVPNFVVIPCKFYNEIALCKQNTKIKNEIFKLPDELNKKLLETWHNEFNDKKLVIRSSAQFEDTPLLTFAGQYSSFLGVKTFSEITKAIGLCYQSLNSNNAKIYAKIHQVSLAKQKMAIIIQELADITCSGVMFTAEPVFGNKQIILIEYVNGLGDELTSGQKTPLRINLKKTKSNSDFFLEKLRRLALEIETVFDEPRDVEWGYNSFSSQFFLFQSRPIIFKSPQLNNSFFQEKKFTLLCCGQTASRGNARGRLIVIKSLRDLHAVKKGDILYALCPISNHFIEALDRSAGLLFKGGILSHFAVIMREFGKPCITSFNNEENLLKHAGREIFISATKQVGKILSFNSI